MIDIKLIIEKRILNDEEEKRRATEPIESFHCSLLGYCKRQIFLSKIHAKMFDLRIKGSMESGTSLHNRIESYRELREVCEVEVPVRHIIDGSPAFIVGSADLVARDKSAVYDLKSINGLMYVMESPMSEHIEQVNSYLKCLNIENGQIIYINKADMKLIAHSFKYNEILFQETIRKILIVYDALKKWDAEGKFEKIPFDKCYGHCFFCETEQLHPDFQKLLKE